MQSSRLPRAVALQVPTALIRPRFTHLVHAAKTEVTAIGAVDVTRSKTLDRDEEKEQARKYRRVVRKFLHSRAPQQMQCLGSTFF